ncbi:MAG: response regulator transcription factor [Ktedonobacteraceae bacterium]|nr:response regulator transcription factor [Ktedonobacteraceae bacterium]
MKEPITIVLVDDHHIVRKGLQRVLEMYDDMRVIGEAGSGEEVLQHIEEWLPAVVVMDMLMPGGMDGAETIRRLHALAPNVRVVMLTSYSDDTRVIAALRAGAIGYVRKEAEPELLLASIRAAARGQSLLDPAVANVLLQELIHEGRHTPCLTEREQTVLRQLALGQTNREIAETLTITEETVKTHVGNILTKLQLAHRTQAAIYAIKKGFISLDEIQLPFPEL